MNLNKSQPISITLLFCFLLTWLWHIAVISAEAEVNPHDYEKRNHCAECHVNKGPDLIEDPVDICIECHPNNIGDHIIDIIPKMTVPSSLPLTKDGRMTCYTCHDQHNKLKKSQMLRLDYDNLCISCHTRY